MSDLIERQAAIDELKTRRDAAKKWYDEVSVTDDILTARADSAMASFIEAILMIKKLPPAEPEKRTGKRTETHECDLPSAEPQIIRCKDCIESYRWIIGIRKCKRYKACVTDNDFCSRAERREDGGGA